MKSKHDKMLPLTGLMKKFLADSYRRELDNLQPLGTYYTRSARGLFQRGLLEVEERSVDGKILCVFRISDAGKEYMKAITPSS